MITIPTYFGTLIHPSAGGGNNVVIVSANTYGSSSLTSAQTMSFNGNVVTSGNLVVFGAAFYGAGHTPAVGDINKVGGSATIGSVVLDSYIAATGNTSGVAIYHTKVTGTGTLSLAFNGGADVSYCLCGVAEFSGVNTTPLGVYGSNSGTGTAHTTNAITTTSAGVIVYVGSEVSTSDFTRTYSDSLIYKCDEGSSQYTAIIQYKIESTSPNTMTDTTGTDSSDWNVCYAQYVTG